MSPSKSIAKTNLVWKKKLVKKSDDHIRLMAIQSWSQSITNKTWIHKDFGTLRLRWKQHYCTLIAVLFPILFYTKDWASYINYFHSFNNQIYLMHVNHKYSLENVAASSFRSRSSLRNFIIVSDTILFSVSYLDFRLAKATWGDYDLALLLCS